MGAGRAGGGGTATGRRGGGRTRYVSPSGAVEITRMSNREVAGLRRRVNTMRRRGQ